MAMFEHGFFANNRQKILDATGAELIVLAANGLLQRSSDTTFAFRQESNFWYLTGINEHEFIVVLTPGDVFLIAPWRAKHRDQWDGAIDKRGIKSASGIKTILSNEDGWERLAAMLAKTKKVYANVPRAGYIDMLGMHVNPTQMRLVRELREHGTAEVVNCKLELAKLRQIKQEPEIAAIQRAVDITTASLEDVRATLGAYTHEYEVEADIFAGFRRRGAIGHGYGPIVASGRNAATIHYMDNGAVLDKNAPLLLDVGAEYGNYSADITRAWTFKKPTARQKAIHAAVMSTYAHALGLLKPGIVVREYEKKVDDYMAAQLVELKLLTHAGDRDALRRYYPHLVSHFLGLDVHDAGDYDSPVEPGMVLTVEPGIYVPDENIGIRIEDDVLITEDGAKVLSASLSQELY